MNPDNLRFKKGLYFETVLIVLFISTFALYLRELLPLSLKTGILGTVGLVGLFPVVRSAFRSLKEKKASVDLLAAIALFFSFINAEWGSMLFINLMLSGARMLDIYTRRRVRVSLEGLMKLRPTKARVLRNDTPIEVPLSEIKHGDTVVINLGEQVPVDGVVLSGSATVNQASLTGESIPVLCEKGSTVLSATIVMSGNIVVRADRTGDETTFEKMIQLVERSHDAKTRMRTSAENFASWYIVIMLIVAITLYMTTKDTRLVLAVVLVVCADDIAIAVPLAYIAAIGTAARRGIIVKSADFLEQAGKITTLVVDKTGTLTFGKMAVIDVLSFGKIATQEIIQLAGTISARSTHPVSVAITEYAKMRGLENKQLTDFREFEGRGVVGTTPDKNELIFGRDEFLVEQRVPREPSITEVATQLSMKGNNVTFFAVNKKIVGLFALADKVRSEVSSVMDDLKKGGISEVIMLTGDNAGVAKSIASELHIDKYYSKLLPEHKVFVLEDYLGKKDRTVAMVGDGVNDAAVLTRADIGIAMGGIGSDIAIESADIVLMQDNFEKVVEVRNISKKVRKVVQGNFVIWGIVNAIGLYFVFTHVFDPARAAAYNFLTDFIPIINSLRLFHYQKKEYNRK